MEVFLTPSFKAAFAARGGSPFAILTASQQDALFRSYDEIIMGFHTHPGFFSNDNRTAAEVDELYKSISYLASSLVCLFPLFLLISFSFFLA